MGKLKNKGSIDAYRLLKIETFHYASFVTPPTSVLKLKAQVIAHSVFFVCFQSGIRLQILSSLFQEKY